MKRIAVTGLVLVALFAVTTAESCGGKDPSHTDASQPKKAEIDTSAPKVLAFPDTFPNVASKCGYNGERIYVVSDDGAQPVIIQNAPECKK